MAPGRLLFVTNFRMFLRCTELRNFGRRGLRITPIATITLNTRQFSDKYLECLEEQKKLKKKTEPNAESEESDSSDDPDQEIKAKNRQTKKTVQNSKDTVGMKFIKGIPHLTIPLPSRNERCEFTLKPISHTVGDFVEMLKTEDRGIDRATLVNSNGVRIASTCSIESLLDDSFWIHINDKKFEVVPPKREKPVVEELDQVGDVRRIIAQLYEALNVGEYQLQKSNELEKELEKLRFELEPMEEKKTELNIQSARRTNLMTWIGLGLMSVQFGILARLTWWEYSWDIMEPVTYFVTYGTTMAMYAYYCVTKREYIMEHVKNREFVLSIYRNAKKQNFDIETYNNLKRRVAEIEYDLHRLRDPLNMQLSPHMVRRQMLPPNLSVDTNPADDPKGDTRLLKAPSAEAIKSKIQSLFAGKTANEKDTVKK